MQNFLSTLAQLSGTLLSIFLAAVIAYYVFLQDRSSQLREQIEQFRLDISESLILLRTKWPWNLTMYLPLEFKDAYRSKYPDKTQSEFFSAAVGDVIFQNPKLEEALSEVRNKDPFKGHRYGRVYYWILNEGVEAITVGTADARPKPDEVFPSKPQGPGFDEWRASFKTLAGPIQFLSDFQLNFHQDFKQFTNELPQEYRNMRLLEFYERGVQLFFNEVGTVKTKLNEMEKQEAIMKAYSFSGRVHLASLVILTCIAVLLGILVPLILLALSKDPTPTLAIVLLISSLSAMGGAFFQFSWDVSRSLEFDEKAYVKARWYVFLNKEIERQIKNLDNGGMVDTDYFIDARNSSDKKRFPDSLVQRLENFINQANNYNDIAQKFNALFLQTLKEDKNIGPAVAGYKSLKGGPFLYPFFCLLDDEKWQSHLDQYVRNVNEDIGVEVPMSRWMQVAFQIPVSTFAADIGRLSKSLNSVRDVVRGTDTAKQFLQVKAALHSSVSELAESLNRAAK